MNKQTKNKTLIQIIDFPNKINLITMLIVIIVYGIGLLLLARVITPDLDYVIELNYPKATYNTEINPYIFVRGTAINVSEDESKTELRPQFRVIAYINAISPATPSNVFYAYSALDEAGMMNYFFESTRPGKTLPVFHQVVASSEYPSGDRYTKYFVKVNYDITEGTNVTKKTFAFSEDAFDLTKSELNDNKFKTLAELPGILEVKFTFTDDGVSVPQYDTNIDITFDTTNPYHVNLQSWIITEDGQIFPYIGIYNYCTPKDLDPWYETSVYKYIKPKTIYLKLEYTDANNQMTPLYYKVDINTLLNSEN
ncbi:MAG: hypothetical protein AB7V00_03270 [Bacilli bacterium]